jgi:hypothetical protein
MLTEELLQHISKWRSPFLYHLTAAENVESILVLGVVPGAGESEHDRKLVRPGHVYLCNGATAIRSIRGQFDQSWGDAAFRVDIRTLESKRFNADEDYWRGHEFGHGRVVAPEWKALRRAFPKMDEPERVHDCLLEYGSVAYRGRISPSLLLLCRLPRRADLPQLRKLKPIGRLL